MALVSHNVPQAMSAANNSDRELVARCLVGNHEAFEELYSAHGACVVTYFLRSGFGQADAQDLTQETFLRVYKSLTTYDGDRGSFRLWLAAIARNVARRQWSRRNGPENFDPELAEEIFTSGIGVVDQVQVNEEIQAVQDCLAALPEGLQQIIRLLYVEGRTTRGIAAAMSMPEATVRLKLRGAHGMLQRCLKTKGFSP